MGIGPPQSRRGRIALVAILAIVAGVAIAPQVYSAVNGPDGTVRVVELEGTIDESKAQFVEDQLRDARHNGSVEAVVLEVNSGGGLPAQSERIYAAVERTSEEMPVIAAIDTLGASGAYLSVVPADEIYAAPSAQAIGSVGVTGAAPTPHNPSPGDTGPAKSSTHPDAARENREILADLFLESVMTQRGDEIELGREEVARANVYLGTEAVENGFVDELGFVDGAIEEAADRAGLDSYDVDTRRTEQQQSPLSLAFGDRGETVVVAREDTYGSDHLVLAVAPQFVDASSGYEVVYHSGAFESTADASYRTARAETSGQTGQPAGTVTESGGEDE